MKNCNNSLTDGNNQPIILFVDDDIKILRLISIILAKSGYCAHCVSSATAALNWLKFNVPHIIFMDINLPGKDGFGILEDIKKNINLNKTKVIAFTSYAMKGDRDRFIEAGFDDYFPKPFTNDTLISFLDILLDKFKSNKYFLFNNYVS